MKNMKLCVIALSCLMVLSGCGTMNNTTKGGLLGAGGGAAVGSIIGAIAGKGKGAAIGAAIGTAVGGTAGVLIGKKMDKARAAAEAAVQDAQVEEVTDANGLSAVKVTFDSGILFATNKSDLNSTAKSSLAKFSKVLKDYPDIDVAIIGHTDNTGNDGINIPLSQKRASSVDSYLKSCGVTASQIQSVEGKGSSDPIASNDTAEGRQQNRRVEVYMYASQEMIDAANAGTLQ